MFCKYCNIAEYNKFCTCAKNGEICPFVRRCTNERRWKPLDTMSKCKLGKDEVVVPKGQNKVRFALHGELYVEDGEFVYSIKNPYDYVPEFVEIVDIDGIKYIKGFEPQIKSSKKKKKDEEDAECQ